MSKKTRTFTLSMLLTLMLLVLTASIVAAAPPLDLHIEVRETIGTSGETFTASGSAVPDKVCATGTVDDLSVVTSGSGSGGFVTLHVLKRFYCAGSGDTFDVQMVVKLNLVTHSTTANWKIIGGTGKYADLKGHGSLVGTPVIPGTSIDDVYDGKVK